MRTLSALLLCLFFAACSGNSVKEKTKEAINKTGETVGKGASEFFDGVADGVADRFKCKVELSPAILEKGLEPGKVRINGSDSGSAHVLSVYLIFNKDVDQPVTIKAFDEENKEYGRINGRITGKKGDARFVDFVFDKSASIETNSLFKFE